MKTFTTLEMDVIRWAEDRGILQTSSAQTQLLKTASEFGELCDAVIKDDEEKIIDGIGDVLVTLIIVSAKLGYGLVPCLQVAYDQIKDRTGKLQANGTFIKDGD